MNHSIKATLVIGASSGIAHALINEILKTSENFVVAVSRQELDLSIDSSRILALRCDYSEVEIGELSQQLAEQNYSFTQVFICNGLLHFDDYQPEKSLAEINVEQMQAYFQANAIIPILWLAQLAHLPMEKQAQICVFSARIGSISDNKLGGWYGYRGSKAAMNMMVKCAAIELKRRFKQWQFVLFHPGTTNTKLSKPFQANVKPEQLFSPAFVAEQLLLILNLKKQQPESVEEVVDYVDWQGKPIAW